VREGDLAKAKTLFSIYIENAPSFNSHKNAKMFLKPTIGE
jgi:hypothetical protein